ncbi:Dolichol kinase sec59 [Pseudocercospora fuligena]|uniref:dolichol kinase n=1 Tax=Pseudocercospora fuligena TaxID=685502 RepID=A0A8H6RPW5_9PEZI|nr:Dolichol kinase sec59 [Pseudocercospora fuligena]
MNGLKPPDPTPKAFDDQDGVAVTTTEAENLRDFSRTPRPYLQRGETISQEPKYAGAETSHTSDNANNIGAENVQAGREEWQRDSGQMSISGSDSGTEADDERPSFVKALPSSTVWPRKGLKTGEQDEDALLTPSQLDDRERELRGYFSEQASEKPTSDAQKEKEDREKLQKRRWAEFVRRTSEVVLMGVIVVAVLSGKGVGRMAWIWRRELLSHVLTIMALIVSYPVKLSVVDTAATHTSIWQRFRVPASFDPATVLYPPLLPVLVALSVAPSNPAVILPNIILGLASLPQRLFPRSSRLGGYNAVHWMLTIIPLIVSQNTEWPDKKSPPLPYSLKTPNGLSPETLVSLYPLHHALMQPLAYLTSTSLLISELHLLSAVLINLLLLASSPQAVILKSCLWIGGIPLFVLCRPVLHWNVTLARIPKWKLRRPGHTAEERKSLVDAVSDLIHLQRAAGAFSTRKDDSDADEDMPSKSVKQQTNGRPTRNASQLVMPTFKTNLFKTETNPEFPQHTYASEKIDGVPRPRRNTVPEREPPWTNDTSTRQVSGSRRRVKSSNLLWCLQLTPEQAWRRKWLYAGVVYLSIVSIIFVLVRWYVSTRALFHLEPVGWAIGYLFGQLPWLHSTITDFKLDFWVPLPNLPDFDVGRIPLAVPIHIDAIRDTTIGSANVRLLLVAYWVLVLLLGLLTVFSLTAFVEVDTRRKVFHGVMVAMFVPTAFVDPCFCALALALVLAIFLILEVIRAGQVPPIGNAIGRFVAPYVDGRDLRGPVVVSHIFLLIGCAVPLWFSLASINRAGDLPWRDWELSDRKREVAMVSGVICVGMGDAAASLIGRRYGRRKWIWVGGKSLEGSAAFAVAVTIGLMAARAWQVFGGWNDANKAFSSDESNWTHFILDWIWALIKAVFCACGASFMEAVLTGANDNVVVPVALWLLVKGVRL